MALIPSKLWDELAVERGRRPFNFSGSRQIYVMVLQTTFDRLVREGRLDSRGRVSAEEAA